MPYGSRRSSSNDVVLESRHLVGLFVLMVVIFGVVFVLGFELGRNQYGEQVRAASQPPADVEKPAVPSPETAKNSAPPVNPPAKSLTAKTPKGDATAKLNSAAIGSDSAQGSPPADYDFYKLNQPNPPSAKLTPPAKTDSTAAAARKNSVAPSNKPATAPVKQQTTASATGSSQTSTLDAPLIPKGSYMLQVAALNSEADALALAQALQKKKFAAFVIPPSSDHYYRVQVGPYPDGKTAEAVQKALDKAGFKAIVKH